MPLDFEFSLPEQLAISTPFETATNDIIRVARLAPNRAVIFGPRPSLASQADLEVLVEGNSNEIEAIEKADWGQIWEKAKGAFSKVVGVFSDLLTGGGGCTPEVTVKIRTDGTVESVTATCR